MPDRRVVVTPVFEHIAYLIYERSKPLFYFYRFIEAESALLYLLAAGLSFQPV
jgi:hypothetical protein